MSANWQAAKLIAPVEHYDSGQWREHWTANPDSFLQVLGDMYRIYKSEEAKKNGTANPQGGRRKTTIDGNVTELWALVTPVFSVEAFPVAFEALRNGRSLRQIAIRATLSKSMVHRFLSGTHTPDRYDIERLSKALDVHPAYFREWREMVVTDLLTSILVAKPNLSISLLKAIS